MKRKSLELKKETIARLDENAINEVKGGKPFSRKPTQCETYVPLCVETLLDC